MEFDGQDDRTLGEVIHLFPEIGDFIISAENFLNSEGLYGAAKEMVERIMATKDEFELFAIMAEYVEFRYVDEVE